LFFFIAAQTATAVLTPHIIEAQEREFKQYSEQARKNAPEVLDIQVGDISSRQGFFIAEAKVLKVLRSQKGIKEGDLIKIRYSDISISARKHNEKITSGKVVGPGFKPELHLLEEGKNVRVYVKSDLSGTVFLTLAAGLVSFEPLTQISPAIPDRQKNMDISVKIQCNKPVPEVCNQIYEPVCAQRRLHVYCIKAPCNYYERVTFSNSCKACIDADVSSYVKGTCEEI